MISKGVQFVQLFSTLKQSTTELIFIKSFMPSAKQSNLLIGKLFRTLLTNSENKIGDE